MIKAIVEPATLKWPRKYDILGLGVSATTYDEAVELVIEASRQRPSGVVSHFAVHAVVSAAIDPDLRSQVPNV